MEKTVGAFQARRQLGKILQDVAARGDSFVVERNGEAIAAVIPVTVYKKWQRERAAFFDRLRQIQERANLEAEEAEALANQV
jgi:prevent-host-death family protein